VCLCVWVCRWLLMMMKLICDFCIENEKWQNTSDYMVCLLCLLSVLLKHYVFCQLKFCQIGNMLFTHSLTLYRLDIDLLPSYITHIYLNWNIDVISHHSNRCYKKGIYFYFHFLLLFTNVCFMAHFTTISTPSTSTLKFRFVAYPQNFSPKTQFLFFFGENFI
jgi:hypothetical protein